MFRIFDKVIIIVFYWLINFLIESRVFILVINRYINKVVIIVGIFVIFIIFCGKIV